MKRVMVGIDSRQRFRDILGRLVTRYGTRPWNWHTQRRPFEVLIATVLSQRTRDEKTDEAAKALFSHYPTPEALAAAPVEHVEQLIRPSNYYRTKAVRIQSLCRALLDRHGGEVPRDSGLLLALPSVGRKTAACVMVYGFGEPAIPVDVHVHRLANRFGVIRTRDPEATETALWGIIDPDHVLLVNELLVKHGQTVCKPIRPECHRCGITDLCDYGGKVSAGQDVASGANRVRPSQRAGESERSTQSYPRQPESNNERSPASK